MLRSYFSILLFFCGFQGWILSFPLFGPVVTSFGTQKGVNVEHVVHAFLLALSLSYVFWGFWISRFPLQPKRLRFILVLDLVGTLLLGLSLYWLPSSLWIVAFVLLGVLGALPPLIWLSLVTVRIPGGKRGFIFGITGFFIEISIYSMNVLVQTWSITYSFFLLQLILLVPLFMLYIYPKHFQIRFAAEKSNKEPLWHWWPLYLFLFVIYMGGGVMYRLIHPYIESYPNLDIYLGNLPYALAMPVIGLLIDRIGPRPFTFIGSTLLGIAFALFAISPSFWGAALGIVQMKVGFAFLDLFILYYLAYLAYQQRNFAFLGVGIGINMLSILSGSLLAHTVTALIGQTTTIAFMVAVIVIFSSFLLIEWVVKKDSSRIEEELKLANQVQKNLLPQEAEFPKNVEIFAAIQPAKEVGGDFYDVISLDRNKALFVIGDVVGKGLPGGMIASSLISHIRSNVNPGSSLTGLLQYLNEIVIRDSRFTMQVTLGLAVVDTAHRTLTYASAGHPFPFLLTQQGITDIEVASFPLGIERDHGFEQTVIPFDEKNILVLYTDGLIEARNAEKQMFGFDRLKNGLQQVEVSLKDRGSFILAKLKEYVHKEEMEDDVTLLMVELKGRG